MRTATDMTPAEMTTMRFRIECRGWNDDQWRNIEVREARDCEMKPVEVVMDIALMGHAPDGDDSFVILTPDAAKRLAIALNHVAFGIDPAPGALGVG
jgi:hypothetical protein